MDLGRWIVVAYVGACVSVLLSGCAPAPTEASSAVTIAPPPSASATSRPSPPRDEPPTSATFPAGSGGASQVVELGCAENDFDGCTAACDAGKGLACHEAAKAVNGDEKGTPTQRATYAALLEKGCKIGDTRTCWRLAVNLDDGHRMTKDVARARRLFAEVEATDQNGCDAGRAEACHRLAMVIAFAQLNRATASAADDARAKAAGAKAVALWTEACFAGDAASCSVAAKFHSTGTFVDADEAQAVVLAETGCRFKDPRSCTIVGTRRMYSPSTEDGDPSGAPMVLEPACDRGASEACELLGKLHLEGTSVPRDPRRTLALFERACSGPGDARIATACVSAADARVAAGEAPDTPRVCALLDQGCRMGYGFACTKRDAGNR